MSVIQERSRDARKPPLALAARSEPAFRYSKAVGFLLRFVTPTILRIGGLRVTIFPNHHGPPHLHVIGAKGEAVFLLNCPGGPAELRESYGFNGTEIRQVANDLRAHIPALCNGWKSIHGHL